MEYGYVYCASNEFMPELSKIGSTERNALTRIDELWKHTGCPTPFTLHYFIKVKNPRKYEIIIHNKLNEFRVNASREFFKIKPELAQEYFNIDNLIENEDDKQDFAENYLIIYDGDKADDEVNEYKNNKVDNVNKVDKIKNKYSIVLNIDKKKINTNCNNNIMFECEKCNKQFMFDSLLKKHQSRKRSCVTPDDYNIKIKNITETINNKINESLKTNTLCMFCEKHFLNKSNLSKHLNIVCPSKLKLEKDKNQIIEDKKNQEKDNEIKQLRNDMTKLLNNQKQNVK
jgi:hypothetical protein